MLEVLHPTFEGLYQQDGKSLIKMQIEDKPRMPLLCVIRNYEIIHNPG